MSKGEQALAPPALASSPALARGMLDDLIGYALRRAQVRVFADFVASLGDLNLTPGRFGVLTIIAANRDLNQSRLGEALGVDRSTVVGVIDDLERRGWVRRRRSPRDRRAYRLELTAAGRDLWQRARGRVRAHERRIAAELSADEQAMLRRLLDRLAPAPAPAQGERGGERQDDGDRRDE